MAETATLPVLVVDRPTEREERVVRDEPRWRDRRIIMSLAGVITLAFFGTILYAELFRLHAMQPGGQTDQSASTTVSNQAATQGTEQPTGPDPSEADQEATQPQPVQVTPPS